MYLNKYRALFFCALVLFSGCSRSSIYKQSKAQIGTLITLTVMTDKAQNASEIFTHAFSEVDNINSLMSPYEETSDVSRINAAVESERVKITTETYKLISESIVLSHETKGAFDITFASAGKLWNFKESPVRVPSIKQVENALENVGYTNLVLNANNEVFKEKTGVKIGLGAIAKGYAIKKCVESFRKDGVTSGIVDAGGDIQVIGQKFGKDWKAGIRHPRKKESLIAIVALKDGEACATSGDYERVGFSEDGKRYHHIIDPRTGYPTETFASVTVICDDAVIADSYATAIFVLGLDKAKVFVHNHPEIEVFLIDLDLNIYMSEGLKKRINVSEQPGLLKLL